MLPALPTLVLFFSFAAAAQDPRGNVIQYNPVGRDGTARVNVVVH